MAPELLASMEADELRQLAAQVREYQLAKGLSDNALVKKFAGLGSTKTFKRILDNDLAELDLERQLGNYRAVWAFIESVGDQERPEEKRYDDLFATIQLRRVFTETTREMGLARAIFLLGPTGAGKTEAQRWLIDRYGARILPIRASVAWNDSPNAMLAAILSALGVKEHPAAQHERLVKVTDKLGETRRCLDIEDAHHLGPRCLNLVVTLIDETPGEVILAAIDTLWARLETKNYEECRQLTGNRMAERINLGRDVREADARKLLQRGLTWVDADPKKGDAERALVPLLAKANSYGRLAFVRETIKRAKEKAGTDPVSFEAFLDAITEEIQSR